MKRVVILSKYRGANEAETLKNADAISKLCRRAALLGVAPFASHAFYPQFLDDANEAERTLGLMAGRSWMAAADEVWVAESTLSEGMRSDLVEAERLSKPIFAWLETEMLPIELAAATIRRFIDSGRLDS